MRPLWRPNDIRLSTGDRLYTEPVMLALLYGSETWPLETDMRRHSSSLYSLCWQNMIGEFCEAGSKVLGSRVQTFKKAMNINRFKGLGHVSRVFTERLPRRTPLSEVE